MNKQGDTTKVFLKYTYDETPIEEETFDEIVLQINQEGQSDSLTFKLSNNTIQLDSGTGYYYIQLTQAQSLKLGRTMRYQLSVKKGTEVFSSDIGSITVGELLRTSEV